MKRLSIFSYIMVCTVLLLCNGCNKESMMEGFEPEPKNFNINQIIPMVAGQSLAAQLDIEGTKIIFHFVVTRGKATSTNAIYGYTVNDSVLNARIETRIGSTQLVVKNSSVNKFAKAETINPLDEYSTSGLLFSAVKKAPYTSGYQPAVPTANPIPIFKINEDGYFVYKVVVNNMVIYGWGHLLINDRKIVFDKYGYQTFGVGKVGK